LKTFVPFGEIITAKAGGVIAFGLGKFEDTGGRITLASPDVAEMNGAAPAGYVQRIQLGPAGLFVRAVIADPVAVKKLRERVYAGFAVVSSAGSDGVPVVERVALVDRPDALGKRSSVQSRELYLKKDFEMGPKISTLDEAEAGLLDALRKVRAQRPNRDVGEAATMVAIRKAQAQPYSGNDGITKLLTSRRPG
jgi:hypothetical protein